MTESIDDILTELAEAFLIPGKPVEARRITKGRINASYRVTVKNGGSYTDYFFQRINTSVFSDPESLMRNICLITEHIASREACKERCLQFRKTADGALFHDSESGCWRVCNYIGHSVSFEPSEADGTAVYMAGKAFGRFNRMLADLDLSDLPYVIPHFHDTKRRLSSLYERIEEDPLGRADTAASEIRMMNDLAERSEPYLQKILSLGLPLHVTHNDTKLNNVLLDRDTLEPLAVIDLDTCMPGLYCYDFGDMIRSAAGGEDETDMEKISFDLSRARACAEGYMSEMRGILKKEETESLPCGVIAVTLELAARFLEDHLAGDVYFQTDRPGRNLERARAQLYLLDDMLSHIHDIEQFSSASSTDTSVSSL